ncbi:DUF5134 domain-containing protein [Saccharopolyspora shandongensis]|uniref:DUF5134 domain-containing protein n=1 Tax=Saccharopolyspora shandongensis TaxID=418495 RepID=UPI003430D997
MSITTPPSATFLRPSNRNPQVLALPGIMRSRCSGGVVDGPGWIRWAPLAALGVLTLAALVRLLSEFWHTEEGTATPGDFSVTFTHVLTGVGMCVMFAAGGGVGPRGWWVAFFLASAVWICFVIYRVRPNSSAARGGVTRTQYVHLLVVDLAMVYMFAAAPSHGFNSVKPGRTVPPPSTHTHDPPPAVPGEGHAHGSTADVPGIALPLVAWVLMTFFVLRAGYSAVDLITRREAGSPNSGDAGMPLGRRVLLSPEIGHVTAFGMELGMAYMLFVML